MSHPNVRSKELDMRQEVKKDSEPLLTRERTVARMGKGPRPYANIPESGMDIIGLSLGDDINIEIYQDGIFISPANPD